jgi:hypothetical protein
LDYCNVTVSAPAAKLTASPLLIALLTVSAAQIHTLPADAASTSPQCVTVPHPAVGVAKLIALLLLVVPPVPVLAVVLPAL